MYGACGCQNGGYSGAHFHGPGYFADSIGLGDPFGDFGDYGAVMPEKDPAAKRFPALRTKINRLVKQQAAIQKQINAAKKRKAKKAILLKLAKSYARLRTDIGKARAQLKAKIARGGSKPVSMARSRQRKARIKARMASNPATGIYQASAAAPASMPGAPMQAPGPQYQTPTFDVQTAPAFSTEASEAAEEASDTSEEGESGGLTDITADNWYKSPLVWAAAAVGGFLFLRKKRRGGGDAPRQNPRRNRRNRR